MELPTDERETQSVVILEKIGKADKDDQDQRTLALWFILPALALVAVVVHPSHSLTSAPRFNVVVPAACIIRNYGLDCP